jgi:hypothetical protein
MECDATGKVYCSATTTQSGGIMTLIHSCDCLCAECNGSCNAVDVAALIDEVERLREERDRTAAEYILVKKSEIPTELLESIECVECHQAWRRGAEIEMTHPKKLGLAIDETLKAAALLVQGG